MESALRTQMAGIPNEGLHTWLPEQDVSNPAGLQMPLYPGEQLRRGIHKPYVFRCLTRTKILTCFQPRLMKKVNNRPTLPYFLTQQGVTWLDD